MKWAFIIATAIATLILGSNALAHELMNGSGDPDEPVDPFFAWDSLIKRYADSYGVPFVWIKGIMMNESSLGQAASVRRGIENPEDVQGSKSSDGKSWGLMQLTLPTARMFENVTEVDLNDPETSVRLGAKYLQWLMGKTPSPYTQEEFVIRAYNGGPGFRSTVAGQRDTPAYYARWKANVAKIKERQTV